MNQGARTVREARNKSPGTDLQLETGTEEAVVCFQDTCMNL